MRLRLFLAVWVLFVFTATVSADCIALRPRAVWMERAAAADLQRVIYAATGSLLPIRAISSSDTNVIAVGFAPGVKVDLSVRTLGDQGYVLKSFNEGRKTMLIATGATPVATTYALYSLAERFGAGFYLGGDALPVTKRPFALPTMDVANKPILEVRGVLPWYNFFDSPTAWNAKDYRFFIDQLAKSKNNFLGFHSYDSEPFCTYTSKDGHTVAGAPLISTAQPTWGTSPMKTSEFGYGTSGYFAKGYFGADCSIDTKTPEQGIADAKKLLVDALWYAKARGVRTCVGFEVSGDPTAPGEIDNLELRLKELIRTYPMLDYVWIWEPEAMGLTGSLQHPSRSDFGAYYRRWQDHFADITDSKRKTEAVRMGIYALAAHRILQSEAPKVRMVLSGWGGDNHLHFSDFYPGLDKILPKDIVFSALDNIITSDTVSEAYGKLSKDREFWPIPWFEYDGDQWMPQPNTKHFFNNARDSVKKGTKGLLGIHWRTRDMEESQAYISQYAWDANLSYEGFYRGYAQRRFGDERAAKLLMSLQELGYRWLGAGGQNECANFTWVPAPLQNVERLKEVFNTGKLRSSEALDYLKATYDWSIAFDGTSRLLHMGGEIRTTLDRIKAEKRAATAQEREMLTNALADADTILGNGILAYASRMSNRGELGVLATINTKAVADIRATREAVQQVTSQTPQPPVIAKLPLAVRSILPLSTALAGQPFRISAVVDGASSAAKAEVFYKRNNGTYASSPLKLVNTARIEGEIPAAGVKGDVLDYYLRVTDGNQTVSWPKEAPKSVQHLSVVRGIGSPGIAVKPAPDPKIGKIAKANYVIGPMAVTLSWPDITGLKAFRLTRQMSGETTWAEVGSTVDNWYEDRGVQVGSSYIYRVQDVLTGAVIAQSDAVTIPEPPIPAAPELTTVPLPGRVRLQTANGGDEVGGYHVYRAEKADGVFEIVDFTGSGSRCVVQADPGKAYYYQLRALSLNGKEGPASLPTLTAAMPLNAKPIVSLDFNGTDAVKVPNTVTEDGFPAMRVDKGSFAQLPHLDAFNAREDIGIEFWVKLSSPGDMPVFVCHGAWSMDGYFVQLLAGRVRFYLAGVGTLDTGGIEVGRWTQIAATYEGSKMVVYINGQRAGALPANGEITPCSRPLYLGRYDQEGDAWTVNGYMAGLRIFPYALTDGEVARHYQQQLHATKTVGPAR